MIRFSRRMFVTTLAGLGLTRVAGTAEKATAAPDFSALPPDRRAQAEEAYRKIMAALPYEHVAVPGAQALAEWQKLKEQARGWPVVIGPDEELERIAEQFSIDDPSISGALASPIPKPRSPAEILKTAEAIRFPKDLAKWPGAYQPEDLTAEVGDWPKDADVGELGLSIADDLDGKPYDRVHILLIPAKASWEVPAYLRWGNWNACPPAEYHVAALRSWHEKFGAELIGINGDTMNIRASRLPRDRATAMALARDQYRYCPDIVDQGVETLSALAATLSKSSWWYLWWD